MTWGEKVKLGMLSGAICLALVLDTSAQGSTGVPPEGAVQVTKDG